MLRAKKTIDLSNKFTFMGYPFRSSTPCIIRKGDGFLMLNRCNNGDFDKSVNQLMELDNDFTIKKTDILPYFFTINGPHGYEDMRLFQFQDKLYYIGVHRRWSKFTLVSDVFNGNFSMNKIRVTFGKEKLVEKNWAFYEQDGELRVVYEWFPLTLCKIDYGRKCLVLIEKREMPSPFEGMRGSSCAAKYKDQYWFTVHSNENKSYKHFFVVFDSKMKLVKLSAPCLFEKTREFSYGLIVESEQAIVSYSTDNSTSKIAVYDLVDIPWLLTV